MPTPRALAAILTGAEGDPKLADEDPRDRQFFLDLGGHAGRAHSSAAFRTARRERYVVADVYLGWSAPAGRLAVLRARSSAWSLVFRSLATSRVRFSSPRDVSRSCRMSLDRRSRTPGPSEIHAPTFASRR